MNYNDNMNTLEMIIRNNFKDYVNFLTGNIFLFSIVIFLTVSIFSFLLAYIINKNSKRIKSKIAVYILNNSWISMLAQDLLLSIELTSVSSIADGDDESVIEEQSILVKLKQKFAIILRNISNYNYIADCKNYFRFK